VIQVWTGQFDARVPNPPQKRTGTMLKPCRSSIYHAVVRGLWIALPTCLGLVLEVDKKQTQSPYYEGKEISGNITPGLSNKTL